MYSRLIFFKSPDRLILSLLLVALLGLAGCQTLPTTGPPPTVGPITEVAGGVALQKAQNDFDEASKQMISGEKIPAEARAKYQRVVDTVEKQVLPQVTRDDLKVTAYALDAFSRWQLADYIGAMNTAEKGRNLCKGAATNPRDCAMLQMVEGLVVASQAYEKYNNPPPPTMSQEQMKDFANRMEAALHGINAINGALDPKDPLSIFANQWQLMIIRKATDAWYTYFRKDAAVWKPEVLKWLSRADQVLKKFPAPPYINQDRTLKLQKELGGLKKRVEEPS